MDTGEFGPISGVVCWRSHDVKASYNPSVCGFIPKDEGCASLQGRREEGAVTD